ncbi:MAG: HupE/UreJ family protein [Rickettsiales bacterium]|nr:HupE/UreJ family protein [Rickettsiales bacterium]
MSEFMTSKRFIILFASIFLLGAMPFLILQPTTGASSAGVSAGFTTPIEHTYHLIVLLVIGLSASIIRQNALLLMPLSFILLYVVGMTVVLDHRIFKLMPMFLLGSVILFGIVMSLVKKRTEIIAVVLAASVGFHFGMYYGELVPDIASPLYFMIGNILSFALILATAASFGLTLRSDNITRND